MLSLNYYLGGGQVWVLFCEQPRILELFPGNIKDLATESLVLKNDPETYPFETRPDAFHYQKDIIPRWRFWMVDLALSAQATDLQRAMCFPQFETQTNYWKYVVARLCGEKPRDEVKGRQLLQDLRQK